MSKKKIPENPQATPEIQVSYSVNPNAKVVNTNVIENIYRRVIVKTAKLDRNKLLILPKTDLIILIAFLVPEENSEVHIIHFANSHSSDDEDIGCFSKNKTIPYHFNYDNIQNISDIKIVNQGIYKDFKIAYNDIYNRIREEYKISLDLVSVTGLY